MLALCARALGAENILAVLSPERESGADTLELSRAVVASVGTAAVEHDLSPVLDAFGCYRLRDEALAAVIPEYEPGWRSKIVLPSALGPERLRVFTLVAQGPDGEQVERRLPAGCLPLPRRRDELQAARAQDARVLPRGPARTTRSPARRTASSTTRDSSSRTATARPT